MSGNPQCSVQRCTDCLDDLKDPFEYASVSYSAHGCYSLCMSEPGPTGSADPEAETPDKAQIATPKAVDLPATAAVVTALATFALAVAALVALHGKEQQAAVIALVVVALLFLGWYLARRKYQSWPIIAAILIGLLGGMAAFAGFGWWNSRHQVAAVSQVRSGGKHKSTNGQPLAPAVGIRFLDPQPGGLVKQCPRIDGTGRIPAGYGLWIIVVPDTSMKPKQYWIEAQAKPAAPGYWAAAESVSIDSPSVRKPINADLYAVLVDRKWSNYLATSSATGNFSAASLPPSVVGGVIGPITVTRVSGTGTCR